ncbi:flagellar biosynthesis anti-sigma factor FlgM [Paraburkholderia silviterrae]|uniref:Negative regulator of flagellin synthesis n=1 Tax=Paraburkholderia silviterrae TaxID=2528715 RepID=A0A4R5M0P2_9BURK|nr:flagellar biosynthesis anti-sigma factor FlgM [Paraburkholderia silviterrae]TDG18723.1 flagellar biosynthesis anti-sigma factor FlgM [Paraburkholderia silviterrae]
MKIDTSTRNDARSLQDGPARTQQSESASALGAGGTASAAAASSIASGASSDANVSLSSLSSSLRSLAASGAADIDMGHVQSIKDAIKNGTLQIDTGKIADGIIETARGLLKPASGS